MTESQLVTTDGQKVPLRGVAVQAEVLGAHARVVVKQRYKNEEKKAVEAVYTFPLPSDGSLSGFAMICEGRRIEAEIQEREKAFRTYDDALVQGHGAALLEQERPNVFTANVGNLLPNEETVIEIEYLQRLTVDEGSLRWMLPTLVAPRYIPGKTQGNRTGGGWAEPTDAVPDADRITPRIGEVEYGLKLELNYRVPGALEVSSPSHAIQVIREGGHTRVTFAAREVALDRDVVIIARGVKEGPFAGVVAHRTGTDAGYFALSVVPDLFEAAQATKKGHDVVFVIDTSGSMDGDSIVEARSALRLGLRHLREGDRFNIIEFNTQFRAFARSPVAFGEKTLQTADQWVAALSPTGGTELLAPMVEAVKQAGDGVVVLLTDGQVGNEAQILDEVLKARQAARVLSFGIGTNVSDVLLRDLARHTGGAVEFIHPGERIDEKVVAQFSRTLAPRVTNVEVKLRGIESGEVAPTQAPSLVDGDAWVIFGRYATPGKGTAEIRGSLDGKPFAIDVPLDLPENVDVPAIRKLWASERIKDLEAQEVTGRRAGAMKDRITKLSLEHGVQCAHTSFVVVEKRTGDRQNTAGADTRFVPVNAPAGWNLFQGTQRSRGQALGGMAPGGGGAPTTGKMMSPMFSMPPPPPAPMPAAPARAASASMAAPKPMKKGGGSFLEKAKRMISREEAQAPAAEAEEAFADMKLERMDMDGLADEGASLKDSADPITALLSRQLAAGLWDDTSKQGTEDQRRLRATALALLTLLDAGVTTSHALYGAQVKKAVEAIASLAVKIAPTDPQLAELALGIAWLAASGQRTRSGVEKVVKATPAFAALAGRLADEAALRAHVGQLRS